MQATVTEINYAIGAAGVVSEECKTIVAEYGEMILQFLVSEVNLCVHHLVDLFKTVIKINIHFVDFDVQTQPNKICSEIGLCEFNGVQGVGLVHSYLIS